MRTFLAASTVVLAIIAIVIGASYVVLHPTVLKVAVPASDPIDQRVFGAAAEMLNTQRAPVRLELVAVDSTPKALEALESRKVDLVVVRSDAAMRDRLHTVMIMRREVAVLIAPKTGKVQKIADLAGAMRTERTACSARNCWCALSRMKARSPDGSILFWVDRLLH